MVLVVDIGNTNIVIGVYDGNELVGNWRLVTRDEKTSDEYGISILSLLSYNDINHNNINSAIVSSVVPNVMHSFENALKKFFNIEPIIVGPGVKTGITIITDNPREVGAGRIVNIVAAHELYGNGDTIMVIDFGIAPAGRKNYFLKRYHVLLANSYLSSKISFPLWRHTNTILVFPTIFSS
jgi:type III pantothenate kinase